MSNSTRVLSRAIAFSPLCSFNRYTACLNSNCDTSDRSLVFHMVILGLPIITVEKDRLICYAKVLGYSVCEQNVPTCTFAHTLGCSSVQCSYFCSATWQHAVTQPAQAGSEGDGLQQKSQNLFKPKMCHQYFSHGREKEKI